MNVLFHDDIAGQDAIVHPISQAMLGWRRVGPGRPVNVAGEIVGLSADNFTERAIMDAPHHFDERRTIANLESDIETELAFRTFADFDHFQCARNIDSNGLFEVDMLSGGNDGFQMLGMVIGGSSDYDRV